MKYLVYGIDLNGDRHKIRETRHARDARRIRDAGNSPWRSVIVYDASGVVTKRELDRLAEIDHHY